MTTSPMSISVTIRRATSTVVVFRGEELVSTEVIDVGGDDVDAAITEHVRTSAGIEIGPRTAERIKIELGGAAQLSIKGRSLETGVPASCDVVVDEVQQAALAAMEPVVGRLDGLLQRWGRKTSEVHLDGGGALLAGFAERVTYSAIMGRKGGD